MGIPLQGRTVLGFHPSCGAAFHEVACPGEVQGWVGKYQLAGPCRDLAPPVEVAVAAGVVAACGLVHLFALRIPLLGLPPLGLAVLRLHP